MLSRVPEQTCFLIDTHEAVRSGGTLSTNPFYASVHFKRLTSLFRAFKVLVRLGPISFGALTEETPETHRIRHTLERYSNVFTTDLHGMWRKATLQISNLLADHCKEHTFDLFKVSSGVYEYVRPNPTQPVFLVFLEPPWCVRGLIFSNRLSHFGICNLWRRHPMVCWYSLWHHTDFFFLFQVIK